MNTATTPKHIAKLLTEQGFAAEELIFAAQCDLSAEYEFRPFVLALFPEKLLFFVGKAPEELLFTGNKKSSDFAVQEKHEYLLETLSEPIIERQVVGGIFSIQAEGVQRRLCGFTNAYAAEMDRFKKVLEKTLKKEEIKPEDLIDDRPEAFCPKCGLPYPDKERQVCPKCMDKRSVFLRVLSYFKEYKKTIAFVFIIITLNALFNVATPYLGGSVLYNDVLAKNPEFLAKLGLAPGSYVLALLLVVGTMFLVKVVQQGFAIAQGRIIAGFMPKIVYKMKTEIFQAMQKLSVSFFAKRQTGSLLTRILRDSNEVLYFFVDGLPFLLVNIGVLIASSVVMFAVNWKMALLVLFFALGAFFFNFRMMPVIWNLYGSFSRNRRRMGGHINDNLTGARVVRAFGQEQGEIKRFSKINSSTRESELKLAAYDVRFTAIYQFFGSIGYSIICVMGGVIVLQDPTFKLGDFITFINYLGLLNGQMNFLSFIFRWWTFSMNSAQRIFEIVDAVPEVLEKPDALVLPEVRGELVLEKVCFSYDPNKEVLSNISLSVKEGEMLGIVGHSGAGKSTLVNLISRLYDPNSGRILLDGVDLRDLSFSSLRKNIAMVSQESYIFSGTIAENIAYACPDISREEVIRAARVASAHEFIVKLPDGYDTLVGSGGRSLSGGERQRLSIARAVVANPRILILDEATASVDTETEKHIQAALDQLIKGRTTLSIAHRLSTLRSADKLVVIEGGKIVEEGTHLELTLKKGSYFKLMQLQSKALAMRGVGDN